MLGAYALASFQLGGAIVALPTTKVYRPNALTLTDDAISLETEPVTALGAENDGTYLNADA